MKPKTTEDLVEDQKNRIKRAIAPKGSNVIMDWINDINKELPKNH